MPAATARRSKTAPAITAAFALPALAKGEHYAGVLLDDKGAPGHHLVLLPGNGGDLTWEKAKAWAAKQGGELPTRREQSLLMANAKQHIEGVWHWSSEQYASASSYAWLQYFSTGTQTCPRTSTKSRARAVRRVPIR